jgi:hypothetical protein
MESVEAQLGERSNKYTPPGSQANSKDLASFVVLVVVVSSSVKSADSWYLLPDILLTRCVEKRQATCLPVARRMPECPRSPFYDADRRSESESDQTLTSRLGPRTSDTLGATLDVSSRSLLAKASIASGSDATGHFRLCET